MIFFFITCTFLLKHENESEAIFLQLFASNIKNLYLFMCTTITRVARLLSLTATAISVQLLFTANSNSDHI